MHQDAPSVVKTDSKQKGGFVSSDDIGKVIVITGIVALGSTKPKVFGGFLLGGSLLPLDYLMSHPTIYRALDAGAPIAWGLYNINVLDKDGYSRGDVFQRNIAVILGGKILFETGNWLLKKAKPDTKANINVTPLNDGAVLSLSSTF